MISQGKSIRRGVLAMASCLFLLAFAGLAAAAETTRDEFTAQVEPICKTNRQESEKFLKGVKTLVKKNKLKQAGADFSNGANSLEKAEKALAEVEPPSADAAKVSKWLSEIKGEVGLMRQIAAKFKAGNKSKGTSLVVKLERNATKANNGMLAFQFKECKIEPSKYS